VSLAGENGRAGTCCGRCPWSRRTFDPFVALAGGKPRSQLRVTPLATAASISALGHGLKGMR